MVKRKAPGWKAGSHKQHFSPDLTQDADYWSFGVQQPVVSKSSDGREALFVEAIEADLIHHQESVARSLEFHSNQEEMGGSGLMRWVVEEEEGFQVAERKGHRTEEPFGSGSREVWVDRCVYCSPSFEFTKYQTNFGRNHVRDNLSLGVQYV